MNQDDPFKAGCYGGFQTYYLTVEDRNRRVKEFTLSECQAALGIPDLQKSVERAVRRRIYRLEREAMRENEWT